MRILLSTTSVQVPSAGRSRLILQNLGPGTVYFDTDGDVDTVSGIELAVGDIFEFETSSGDDNVWVVATLPSTDLRVVEVG